MSTYSIPLFTLKMVRSSKVSYQIPSVGNHTLAAMVLREVLQDRPTEHLCALMVDNQHHNLGVVMLAQGGVSGLHIKARDVLVPCLVHRASAFILSHNHPSGDVSPSEEDMVFTTTCAKMGKELGCPMLDHIIISSGINRGDFYSFMDRGVMP